MKNLVSRRNGEASSETRPRRERVSPEAAGAAAGAGVLGLPAKAGVLRAARARTWMVDFIVV